MAVNSTANSYFLQVDNNCPIIVGDSPNISATSWNWVSYKDGLNDSGHQIIIDIAAGTHTIKMVGREDGVKLDRIILTNDTSCVPTGTGDSCVISASLTPTITANTTTPTSVPTSQPTSVPQTTPTTIVLPSSTQTPTKIPTPTSEPTVTLAPGLSRQTIIPIADAFVMTSRPNNNYGGRRTIEIDGRPIKIAYMKLDLSPLSGKNILSGKLRFFITSKSTSSQYVRLVDDTSWKELGITYNTRPIASSFITKIPGAKVGIWIEVDVTSAVIAKAGQILSLQIDSGGGDGLNFYSKDNSKNKPELVITHN